MDMEFLKSLGFEFESDFSHLDDLETMEINEPKPIINKITHNDDGKIIYRNRDIFEEGEMINIDEKFEYNEDGKLIHMLYSTGLEKWFEYDEKGRIVKTTRVNGAIRIIEYNENGLISKSKFKDGYIGGTFHYKYNENNLLVERKNRLGKEIYEYDDNNNLILQAYLTNEGELGFKKILHYDENNNVVKTDVNRIRRYDCRYSL